MLIASVKGSNLGRQRKRFQFDVGIRPKCCMCTCAHMCLCVCKHDCPQRCLLKWFSKSRPIIWTLQACVTTYVPKSRRKTRIAEAKIRDKLIRLFGQWMRHSLVKWQGMELFSRRKWRLASPQIVTQTSLLSFKNKF